MSWFPEAKDVKTINGTSLMLDLETFGLRETAPVVSIGAVLFDPRSTDTFGALMARGYYAAIDIVSAIEVCGPAEAGTLQWWFKQHDDAIKALVGEDAMRIERALEGLWKYSHVRRGGPDELPIPTELWANSPSFDCRIIRNACERAKLLVPFHFGVERDVRTIKALAWPDGDCPNFNDAVKHNALADACAQVRLVQAAYQVLGLGYDRATFSK